MGVREGLWEGERAEAGWDFGRGIVVVVVVVDGRDGGGEAKRDLLRSRSEAVAVAETMAEGESVWRRSIVLGVVRAGVWLWLWLWVWLGRMGSGSRGVGWRLAVGIVVGGGCGSGSGCDDGRTQ